MTRGRERILFISPSNPYSTKGFSGTLFSARAALEAEFGNFEVVSFQGFSKAARFLNKVMRPVVGRGNLIFHPGYGRLVSRYASFIARRRKPDAIIAVAASPYLAFIETSAPIIYCSDATFQAISRLYDEFKYLPPWSAAAAEHFEQCSLSKAAAVVVSSDWARNSAITEYGIDPGKVSVLAYGANFKKHLLPEAQPDLASSPADTLRLLYVGMDWKRKGGEFALYVARALREQGVAVHLDMVGRVPTEIGDAGFVTRHGLLNKDDDVDAERLATLFRQSHLLILPTLADATPVVFSEAAAFAVPAITFDVGGVASAVIDGVSGFVFPLSTGPDDVARRVAGLVADPGAYAELRRTTYLHSRTHANWDNWGRTVAELTRAAIRANGARPAGDQTRT